MKKFNSFGENLLGLSLKSYMILVKISKVFVKFFKEFGQIFKIFWQRS